MYYHCVVVFPQITTYPRTVSGSVRREDDRRKVKRKQREERKAQEKEQKEEELKRLKKLKRNQIQKKLEKIKSMHFMRWVIIRVSVVMR